MEDRGLEPLTFWLPEISYLEIGHSAICRKSPHFPCFQGFSTISAKRLICPKMPFWTE
jgi:hypothetical protein